ncbi:MAG: PAS domain-containing protein [Sphingomonas adhaesiva]|uniref:PAS domain S-box protein n=1 Tax=Sphingomonas adhaesiva TaxID=28212 RepID=UPI002FF57099
MTQPLASADDPLAFLRHGGEMGRLIAAYDWTMSPLGPIDGWPAALRHTVALMLPTRAEIVLFWGPDHVALYNDAYAPTIGDKHPRAMGRPAREGWAELWDDLGPLLEGVRTTGRTFAARDRPFYIERAGSGEEVYFDISYSAVPLASGEIGGVLCIVSETTQRVRAARAVAEDSQRLHRMFDQAPGFVAVLRQPGHVVEMANAAFRTLIGDRDVTGRAIAEVMPELEAQGFVDRLDQVVATGSPYSGVDVPVRLIDPATGREDERRLDFIYQPIADATGAITAVFVQGNDQTERHRAETALAISRDSLELATEVGGIGTWDCDLTTGVFAGSARLWEMYDVPPPSRRTIGAFLRRVHPDDRAAVTAAFQAAIDPARRAIYDVEYRVDADLGAPRWIAVKGRGIFEGERCVRAIGTAIDITVRRREAEAMRESERRFRTLADGLPALVWTTDAHGAILFASQGFQLLFGIPPARVMAEGFTPLIRADVRDSARAFYASWFTDPRARSGDYKLTGIDGRERWMFSVVQPRFEQDVFVGYVGCAIDVTERHLAGAALEARVAERTAELTRQIAERERMEETLHQMQRLEAVGQLTSGVAHDFNNLLTVVLGNVEMLTRAAAAGPLDARSLERLAHVRTAAERGATLTAQLLAFSRRQRLQAKVVDLNETIGGLVPLMASTLGRSIAIETRLTRQLWPAMVDPTQIELILLNLAINARDAMPGGGTLTVASGNVTLGTPRRVEEPCSGDYVSVAVSDTGTGMSEAVLARAFEPFFTTKEVGKGSGLGLAQVYGFAKQSGGGVRIDTAEGQGTTVTVYLPRAQAGVRAVDAVDRGANEGASIAGRAILVLDDEDAVRDITAGILREAGCRVVEAASGQAALEALAAEPGIDAVVADVAMPQMSGVEFAQRAAALRPALPVLFVTGYADLAAIAHVPEEEIVRKPFTRADLLARVRRMLEGGDAG